MPSSQEAPDPLPPGEENPFSKAGAIFESGGPFSKSGELHSCSGGSGSSPSEGGELHSCFRRGP